MNPAPPPRSRLDLALRTGAVVLTLAFIVLLTFVPVASNDVWLQAKIGEMIVQNGAIPRTVLFPFTWVQANVFNAHEWLPSIVFHELDLALGHNGLLFAQGSAGLILFGLSLWLAVRLSHSLSIGLLLAASAMVVANYRFHFRPELFALAFFLLLLLVLTSYRARGDWRTLIWSAPITVLWANCHGSFLVGPVLALIFAGGEAAESYRRGSGEAQRARLARAVRTGAPYAVVAAVMAACSLANPLGIELLHFALALSSSEVTKAFVDEWQPTLSASFTARWPFKLFIGAVVATVGVLLALRRRVTVTDLLLLAAFGFLAFQRTRYVVFFGYVALVVCAHLLGQNPRKRSVERGLLGATSALAMLGVALAVQSGNVWGGFPYMVPSNNFTQPMVARLARPEMRGNVLNSYELGAELIYRAYPRLRPSLDSRIDSYGDRYFLLHTQLLVTEKLLNEFIADFDVRYMLLLRRDFARIEKMKSMQEAWTMDFADQKMVLLARRSAAPPGSGSARPPTSAASAVGALR